MDFISRYTRPKDTFGRQMGRSRSYEVKPISAPSIPRGLPLFFRHRAHAPAGIYVAQMCKWNLHKFAEALAPALPLADSKAALGKYDELFQGYYEEGMRRFGSLHDGFGFFSFFCASGFDGCVMFSKA